MNVTGWRSWGMSVLVLAAAWGVASGLPWTEGVARAQAEKKAAPKKESSPAARRQYSTAAGLQNTEQYKTAVGEWQKFLTNFPDDPLAGAATYYLALCQLNAGSAPEAIASFKVVLMKFSDLDKDKLEMAHLYLGYSQYTLAKGGMKDQFKEAADTFTAQVKAFPMGGQAAEALYLRGECFYEQGQKEEAIKSYGELAAKFPMAKRLADALYAMGVTQEELKKYADAGKTYAEFVAKFKEHDFLTEVKMRLGETEFQAGQLDAAAKLFAEVSAVEKFAFADHATMRLADTLSQQKKYAEAAAQYEAVTKKFDKSPRVPLASLLGGKCYFLADDMPKARALLTVVLAAGGADAPEAAHWVARSLLKEKKAAEALPVVEKALPLAEKSEWLPSLLMDQADALYEAPDKRAAAAAVYQSIVAKFPKHSTAAQAGYMAAFSLQQLEKYDDALKEATAFLAANAASEYVPDVLYIAAESNLQLGKTAAAEPQFKQLLEKHAAHAAAETWKVRWGLTLYLQEKYAEVVAGLTPLIATLKTPALLAEAQFLIGSSHVQLKAFAEAAKALTASLAADAKWRQADDALLSLAHAQQQSGDVKAAVASVQKLLAGYPESKLLDRANYRLGEYLFAEKDSAGAEKAYAAVIAKWPDSKLAPITLYNLGWAQYTQGKHAETAATISQLVDKHAQDKLVPAGRYLRALSLHQLKDYAKAAPDLEAFLASKPAAGEASDAQYVLGLCHSGQKKYAEAAAAFEALLKANPKYPGADKALYEWAWALKSADKHKEAVPHFAQLIKDHPASPLVGEALYHQGEDQYQDEKFAEAVASYTQALAKAGKSPVGENAAHKLGWAHYRLDDFAKAQEAFAKQRADYPAGPRAADGAFMEAECQFKLGKFEESLALFEKLPKLENPAYAELAALHSAQAANGVKNFAKGGMLAAAGLKAFPESEFKPEFLYEQAWALQSQMKGAEAEPLYEQVTELTNREVAARARFMVGELYFERKDHEKALVHFIKVKVGYDYKTWQADATYEAARCLEVLKRGSQASKLYAELVEKYPQSDKVMLAKERLKALGG